MRLTNVVRVASVILVVASLAGARSQPGSAGAHVGVAQSPIQHVVVIMMENRTFDNVLGALCVERVAGGDPAPCDGTKVGTLLDGSTIPLALAPDIQPSLNHSVLSHLQGLDYQAGVARMDGF